MLEKIIYLDEFKELKKKPEYVSLAGMKAVNLGLLMNAGFTVPFGFVVTPEWSKDEDKDLEILKQTYTALRKDEVAVRSSCTAEDMPNASFAGIYKSFVPVKGFEAVVEHIEKVRESVHTDSARIYMENMGVDPSKAKMAVLIQHFEEPYIAGVLFTVNTMSGNRNEMACDFLYGRGEAVVSGEGTPVTVTVYKDTLRWKEALRPEEFYVPEGADPRTDIKKSNIFGIAKQIEKFFGYPQDIEFALDSKCVPRILQSRNITGLKNEH